MSFFNSIFGTSQQTNLAEVIQAGALLVDVRSPEEFRSSPVKGAINIPLEQVQSQLQRFKGKSNIIVFCRSGNRSGIAKSILERSGITGVINGGSWQNVKQYVK